MQRRYWTQEEDQALKDIVSPMSEVNWTLVSLRMKAAMEGSDRNAKQCRQRWLNKLNRSGSDDLCWGSHEDEIILQQFIKSHRCEKNKWIVIAERLKKCQKVDPAFPERSANQIKNRFYSIVRKGIRRINNKLGRPILPQEIRLIKPIIISRLFSNMEAGECQEILRTLYKISCSENLKDSQICNQKLGPILQNIIDLNRIQKPHEGPIPEIKSEPFSSKQTLKKRKSSLSTVEEEKMQMLNRSTKIFFKEEAVHELDIVDLFLSNNFYMPESVSVQFQEIDFGV